MAARRSQSLLGLRMMLPAVRLLDLRFILGSVVFGIGWGLAGICPGPAIVLMGAGIANTWVFGAAMLTGMMATFELLNRRAA